VSIQRRVVGPVVAACGIDAADIVGACGIMRQRSLMTAALVRQNIVEACGEGR
jgi:hypothetical protein